MDSRLPQAARHPKFHAIRGLALAFTVAVPGVRAAAPPVSVLTVAGGPDLAHNQVAIESNARYMERLVPPGTRHTILFGDGKPDTATVQYSDEGAPLSDEERAFRLIFGQDPSASGLRYRAPQIKTISGPAQRAGVRAALTSLAAPNNAGPLLLYFTGHGTESRTNHDNNTYDLWSEPGLTVQELSREIARIPENRPVTLVMVQCFSGAFANLLFRDGKPTGEVVNRPICGFFATTRDRVAAGCTPEVNEANYKDFTSYFFAALSGKDRLGKAVPPPDYNKDGRVGMDEAFAYALVTEPSVDVPVATSDVLLRRYVPLPDDILAAASVAKVRSLASPAQKASFDGISRAIGDESGDRLKHALELLRAGKRSDQGSGHSHTPEPGGARVAAASTLREARRQLLTQFPALRQGPKGASFIQTRADAVRALATDGDRVKRVLAAGEALEKAQDDAYAGEIKAARALRLLRVAKSVLLEAELRAGGDTEKITRFERLKALEAGSPFKAAS